VRVARKEAHIPVDLTCAVLSLVNMITPDPRFPWFPEPTPTKLDNQQKMWRVAPKLLKYAWYLDQWMAPLIKAFDGGNAYRVLARRDGS
jgi:hypothetical protein